MTPHHTARIVRKILRRNRHRGQHGWHATDVRRATLTAAGSTVVLRYGGPDDRALLTEFHSRQRPEDLRFRFLSAMRQVPARLIADMLDCDHLRKAIVLALDPDRDRIIGYALAAGDPLFDTAEIAVCVDPANRRQGVASLLVFEAERFAEDRGFRAAQLIGLRENRAISELERTLGYHVQAYPEDVSLNLAERAFPHDRSPSLESRSRQDGYAERVSGATNDKVDFDVTRSCIVDR